jgi:hypothetical protein
MASQNHIKPPMSPISQWLLAGSNLVLASAVSYHVFMRPETPAPVIQLPEPPPAVDMQPLLKPVETLDESLGKFSSTLQRFNTTIVQYDFLQKEIERLGRLDQALGMRLNLEITKKAEQGGKPDKGEAEEQDKLIEQLREIQGKVQKESERRRETMLRLIAGLERELATGGIDEADVRKALGEGSVPAPESGTESLPPTDVIPKEVPAGGE